MVSKVYRHNHYVPEWYQKRFLPIDGGEAKFYYLDLKPDTLTTANGIRYKRKEIMRWGADSCFNIKDLYTTKLNNFESTEIEEKFFGKIDAEGKIAIEYFSNFHHPRCRSQVISPAIALHEHPKA